jgi:hypothetical protein
VGRNPVEKPNSHLVMPGVSRPVSAATAPIQVSTPPVRIIGTGRRHKGGFRLGDR